MAYLYVVEFVLVYGTVDGDLLILPTAISMLPGDNGYLSSLNYPLPYPDGIQVDTTLTAPIGYLFKLTFLQLHLGNNTSDPSVLQVRRYDTPHKTILFF